MYPPIEGVKVVGITGHARHGKDTFAMKLLRCVPGAERMAFSDLMAASERIAGRMKERDPRHLQDTHFRVERQNLLCAMYQFINDRRPPLAIITGVRKPDEVQMIKQMGGEVVKVRRMLDGGGVYQSTDRDPKHVIEADIDSLEADLLFISHDVKTLERCAEVYARSVTTFVGV